MPINDWHAHGQNTLADRVQAFVVTTALEFEAGMLPIGKWFDLRANKRTLNYEASSSWAIADITVLEDILADRAPRGIPVCQKMWLARDPGFVTAIIVM